VFGHAKTSGKNEIENDLTEKRLDLVARSSLLKFMKVAA
jgi:hypothetical protein